MATVIFVCKRKSFHAKWIRIFSCSSTHLLIDRCGLDIFPRLHKRHPGLYPRLTSITIWQMEAEIKKRVSNFQIKNSTIKTTGNLENLNNAKRLVQK